MKKSKEANYILKNYKYYLFCKSSIWVAPIITIFYILNNLSFTEIFIIASYYQIAVAFFEVPTGAFADRYGHKKSVLLGLILIAVSLCLYPLYSSFWYFIAIETILAVGATLISGADEALFYDTLKEDGREKEYAKIKGIARQYVFLSQLIGSIIASLLYTINPKLPFFISGTIIFIAFLIFAKFKEIKHSSTANITSEKYITQIKESGKYIYKHKKLRTVIIYAALINMTYASLIHTYAPYFISVGVDEKYFGIIFAIFNVVALLASRYNGLYIEKTKPYTLIILGIILIISYMILGFVTIKIGIIGILLQQIYRGISATTFQKYINKYSPSEKRATILSYHSLVVTLIGGSFGILTGIMIDNLNINSAYLIIGAITIIITVTMFYYLNKNLSN